MKIEWLNSDYTEVAVTIGLFRKRCAVLVFGDDGWFHFKSTGRRVRRSIDRVLCRRRLDEQARRTEAENASREWQPVSRIPRAQLVERRS